MILVIDAGYHGMVAFSACSTLPVSASIRSSASALARAAPRLVAPQAMIVRTKIRNAAEGAARYKARSVRCRLESRCFPVPAGQLSNQAGHQKQKDALAIF